MAYLGVIALITGSVIAAVDAYARQFGATAGVRLVIAMLVLLTASDLATACVQYVVAHTVTPRRLPRLDFAAGVPESARTMVVVPTMLTGLASVASSRMVRPIRRDGNRPLSACVARWCGRTFQQC